MNIFTQKQLDENPEATKLYQEWMGAVARAENAVYDKQDALWEEADRIWAEYEKALGVGTVKREQERRVNDTLTEILNDLNEIKARLINEYAYSSGNRESWGNGKITGIDMAIEEIVKRVL